MELRDDNLDLKILQGSESLETPVLKEVEVIDKDQLEVGDFEYIPITPDQFFMYDEETDDLTFVIPNSIIKKYISSKRIKSTTVVACLNILTIQNNLVLLLTPFKNISTANSFYLVYASGRIKNRNSTAQFCQLGILNVIGLLTSKNWVSEYDSKSKTYNFRTKEFQVFDKRFNESTRHLYKNKYDGMFCTQNVYFYKKAKIENVSGLFSYSGIINTGMPQLFNSYLNSACRDRVDSIISDLSLLTSTDEVVRKINNYHSIRSVLWSNIHNGIHTILSRKKLQVNDTIFFNNKIKDKSTKPYSYISRDTIIAKYKFIKTKKIYGTPIRDTPTTLQGMSIINNDSFNRQINDYYSSTEPFNWSFALQFIDETINALIREQFLDETDINVTVVDGEDLKTAYLNVNGVKSGSRLANSCMNKHERAHKLKFYTDIPEVFSLAVLKNIHTNNIISRVLLIKSPETGKVYHSKVYENDPLSKTFTDKWLQRNNITCFYGNGVVTVRHPKIREFYYRSLSQSDNNRRSDIGDVTFFQGYHAGDGFLPYLDYGCIYEDAYINDVGNTRELKRIRESLVKQESQVNLPKNYGKIKDIPESLR